MVQVETRWSKRLCYVPGKTRESVRLWYLRQLLLLGGNCFWWNRYCHGRLLCQETIDSFLAPVVLVSFPTLSLTLLTVAELLFNCALTITRSIYASAIAHYSIDNVSYNGKEAFNQSDIAYTKTLSHNALNVLKLLKTPFPIRRFCKCKFPKRVMALFLFISPFRFILVSQRLNYVSSLIQHFLNLERGEGAKIVE